MPSMRTCESCDCMLKSGYSLHIWSRRSDRKHISLASLTQPVVLYPNKILCGDRSPNRTKLFIICFHISSYLLHTSHFQYTNLGKIQNLEYKQLFRERNKFQSKSISQTAFLGRVKYVFLLSFPFLVTFHSPLLVHCFDLDYSYVARGVL